MSNAIQVISHNEVETNAMAEKLAPSFRPGDVIVLSGNLGAGKTVFVRGLVKALKIDENLVNSPTYTLVNEYPGKVPVYHFDLYRMHDEGELTEIGWDDYLNREGIIVVEWGEKIEHNLPKKYYQISIKIIDENKREIIISLNQDE